MEQKGNYYLVLTSLDSPRRQFKAHQMPKRFGNTEFFECFKRNTASLHSTPKWEFLDKPILLPVNRIKEMFLLKHFKSNDTAEDFNFY